jgi:hypothetical protein
MGQGPCGFGSRLGPESRVLVLAEPKPISADLVVRKAPFVASLSSPLCRQWLWRVPPPAFRCL